MKKLIFLMFATLFLSVSFNAQTTTATPTTKTETAKKPIFRATKEQITQVQKMLKSPETGKMDDAFRDEIKKYQAANGLKTTGTLNRATLEKMGVQLTDKQKEMPVDPNSFANGDTDKTKTKKAPVFRATKDQIIAAQKLLKEKNLYAGEASGTLDPATRAALKTYQEANGLKGTGTLNAVTLEKMGIALTDKQKENAAKAT
ncbi:MAG TPA: peptidoglycan-binding domain-containing protein [Pyrinomonadaceae bacterium]|jgi:peptidoglycan hydrolase-like protein with peptidoglycan-binding domain|nr:peptidoglycan-binding domain-containing protein [Pyrinomonadaceae bacterium]